MQPEPQSPDTALPQKLKALIHLCETIPTDVVPAEYYVEELWAALDQTLLRSGCGVGSDTPVGQGGTLDMKTFKIIGAPAPIRNVAPDPTVPSHPSPGVPEPPEYLHEMKDAVIVKHTIQALSLPTAFPLAITHWAEHAEGLKRGLTVCAQPRRILAQQLCDRVRANRKMRYNDKTVGYMIARASSRDTSTKLLYCTEAIVALMMQARLMSTAPALPQDEITTVVIDEVHNRSAHSDYVLALTLAVMQKTPDLRLVLMSATGDHHCQQLVMKGATHQVKRYFLARPMERSFNMLNMIAQIVITYHNDRAGKPLVRGLLILAGARCSYLCHSMVRALQSVLTQCLRNRLC